MWGGRWVIINIICTFVHLNIYDTKYPGCEIAKKVSLYFGFWWCMDELYILRYGFQWPYHIKWLWGSQKWFIMLTYVHCRLQYKNIAKSTVFGLEKCYAPKNKSQLNPSQLTIVWIQYTRLTRPHLQFYYNYFLA